jgi:hypothetical protein
MPKQGGGSIQVMSVHDSNSDTIVNHKPLPSVESSQPKVSACSSTTNKMFKLLYGAASGFAEPRAYGPKLVAEFEWMLACAGFNSGGADCCDRGKQ